MRQRAVHRFHGYRTFSSLILSHIPGYVSTVNLHQACITSCQFTVPYVFRSIKGLSNLKGVIILP